MPPGGCERGIGPRTGATFTDQQDGEHAMTGEVIMATEQGYQGWANRETWAVALHINNDQGWQESVHEAIRAYLATDEATDLERTPTGLAISAGEIIRGNVETTLEDLRGNAGSAAALYFGIRDDIGSLWRVDWDELGAAFLSDLDEQ